MHNRLLVTLRTEYAQTSEEARSYAYGELHDDASFVGESGRFGSPICDWFVIGGRWSGELSRLTWAKDVEAQIAQREAEQGLQVWGWHYGSEEQRLKQEALRQQLEALYVAAVPDLYRGKGLVYCRDTYAHLGYEDDAMLVDQSLYGLLLMAFEGHYDAHDNDWHGPCFADLEGEEITSEVIGRKWLVVVDYHC